MAPIRNRVTPGNASPGTYLLRSDACPQYGYTEMACPCCWNLFLAVDISDAYAQSKAHIVECDGYDSETLSASGFLLRWNTRVIDPGTGESLGLTRYLGGAYSLAKEHAA